MFSLHKALLKKSLVLTLIWFFGMGLFCFNVSQQTGIKGLRLFPLLSHNYQEILWKLSANISAITLHSHAIPSGSIWLPIFTKNLFAFSGLSLLFLLFSLVPYAYLQWAVLALIHWLYYELYMNLLHIGVLDPRNFLVESLDIKLFVAVFSLSYGFALSLWLTGKITAYLRRPKESLGDEGPAFMKLFFTLFICFQFPMIVIASLIMAF